MTFGEFCGGTVWNETLLLNNTWPQFTSCFRNTVLVWSPSGFLWLTSIVYVSCAIHSSSQSCLPISRLNIMKTTASCVLVLLSLFSTIHLWNKDNIPWAQTVGCVIKTLTYLSTILLMQIHRRHGVITSGVLFVYWTAEMITALVSLYTNIMMKLHEDDVLQFTVDTGCFGSIVFQFVLQWFSDLPSHGEGYSALEEYTCPEVTASFPSKVFIWWVTGLIIRGYRKGIEEGDMWQLNPRDTSDTLVPRFAREWDKECRDIRRREKFSSNNNKHNPNENNPLLPSAVRGEPHWNTIQNSQPERQPSLLRIIWHLYRGQFLLVTLLKIISDLLKMASPLVMSALITYITTKSSGDEWKGYTLAAALLVLQLLVNVFNQYSVGYATILGMQIRTICIAAVYRKALTMSNEARKTTTTGEIVNLMSVDCQRVNDVMSCIFLLISTPVQIIVSGILIYQTIGSSVFAGLALIILLVPLNSALGACVRRMQVRNLRFKDQRIKLLDEILHGIKVLKLYAWEPPMLERVRAVRHDEVRILLHCAYVYIAAGISWVMAPFLIVLVTFTAYILADPSRHLDANKAFVTLSLYNTLGVPMFRLPSVIVSTVQSYVSVGRINQFLCTEDLDADTVQYNCASAFAVSIENGVFTWDRTVSSTLKNINLNVEDGSLVAVVGHVGSGKSSILSAILGEMIKLSGTVCVKSSTAYVPQTAWIQNQTLRDNVLFGRKLRLRKYNTVIDACALNADLRLLPSGDLTEIGEKGINLSGGQKQRVSLARAVYYNADIYLLDDPLSSVDSHVGKHIFKNVIGPNGLLRKKTRLLVTHGVHWLPMVDKIIVMKNGCISEAGSYVELLSRDGAFAQFLKTYQRDKDCEENSHSMHEDLLNTPGSVITDDVMFDCQSVQYLPKMNEMQSLLGADYTETSTEIETSKEGTNCMFDVLKRNSPQTDSRQSQNGKLIETERVGTNKVKWSVFYMYAKAAGLPAFLFAVFLLFALQAVSSGAGFYLTDWTEDPNLMNASSLTPEEFADLNKRYLGMYASFALAFAAVITGSEYILRTSMVRAAAHLHKAILGRVFRCPMSFFDTTPSGRIINRLSRDIEVIDNTLPLAVRMFLNLFAAVAAILVTICINTPLFISVMVPLIIIYIFIQNFYIPTSRQLKRIESVTRSPIFVHFSETITGASSIRAYGVTDLFIAESKRRVDENQVYYFAGIMASRWLGFYLELLGSTVIFAAAIFALLTPDTSGSIVGLSVTYALQISNSLSVIVRQMSTLETNIVSVERVKEYSELPIEGEWEVPEHRPPPSWPDRGTVELCGYSTRYRPGLDCVLRDISCTISEGQKIGVVGRTGAGKSSLTLGLFRILEADEGSILIDGINIANLGLHDIRSRLTILPQDSVLFSGSLRMNLDPFSQYPDEEIWSALEKSHLKTFVKSVPGQLSYDCGERGENLSVGQRQLVCLSRALLRHSKILVLDEATAAVDMETDSLIQTTIQQAFEDCTIITIAHRINTVMNYDRILVLDSGQIQEYGAPDDLLQDTNSRFYGFAKVAGIV